MSIEWSDRCKFHRRYGRKSAPEDSENESFRGVAYVLNVNWLQVSEYLS